MNKDYTLVAEMVIRGIAKVTNPLTTEQEEAVHGIMLGLLISIDMNGVRETIRNLENQSNKNPLESDEMEP